MHEESNSREVIPLTFNVLLARERGAGGPGRMKYIPDFRWTPISYQTIGWPRSLGRLFAVLYSNAWSVNINGSSFSFSGTNGINNFQSNLRQQWLDLIFCTSMDWRQQAGATEIFDRLTVPTHWHLTLLGIWVERFLSPYPVDKLHSLLSFLFFSFFGVRRLESKKNKRWKRQYSLY